MCPSGVRGVMRDCQRFILACCERSTLALFTPLYGGRLRVGGLISVIDQAWVAQWKCDLAAFGFISSIAAAVARGLHGKSPSDRSILLNNTVTMRLIFPSIHYATRLGV